MLFQLFCDGFLHVSRNAFTLPAPIEIRWCVIEYRTTDEYNIQFYFGPCIFRFAWKLFHQGLPPPSPCRNYFIFGDRQSKFNPRNRYSKCCHTWALLSQAHDKSTHPVTISWHRTDQPYFPEHTFNTSTRKLLVPSFYNFWYDAAEDRTHNLLYHRRTLYCAYHILVQSNFRRYYFSFLPDHAQILLDHFNVLDELWGEISTGFDNR